MATATTRPRTAERRWLARAALRQALIATAVIAVLIALGQGPMLVIGGITGAAYGLVAIGLTLVYKSSGVFNFAQGEFGTVAVYALYIATEAGLPYGLALLAALGVAVVMGLVTERKIVRPLMHHSRAVLLVATAGLALLAIALQVWIGGTHNRTVDPALPRTDRLQVLGVWISDQRLLILLTVVLVAAGLGWFFTRTRVGLGILAMNQDHIAANLVGIPTRRLSTLVWCLAALLGGLAGVLTAPLASFGPGFLTLQPLLAGFTAAVIGGFTSLSGAFLGGIVVGVAQSIASSSPLLANVAAPEQAALFTVLILVLIVRPHGLLGRE